ALAFVRCDADLVRWVRSPVAPDVALDAGIWPVRARRIDAGRCRGVVLGGALALVWGDAHVVVGPRLAPDVALDTRVRAVRPRRRGGRWRWRRRRGGRGSGRRGRCGRRRGRSG